MTKNVLIVEDDHDTRVAMRDAFEAAGYHVYTTTNGRDGLVFLNALKQPLVVFLDQNMPVMNGDDFLKERLKNPELLEVPVIVMSAIGDRTSHLGATAFISKPLNIDALIKIADQYMANFREPPTDASPSSTKRTLVTTSNGSDDGSPKKSMEFLQWIEASLGLAPHQRKIPGSGIA